MGTGNSVTISSVMRSRRLPSGVIPLQRCQSGWVSARTRLHVAQEVLKAIWFD